MYEIEKRMNTVGITLKMKENVDKVLGIETRKYYRCQACRMVDHLSCPAYLKKVTV